MKVRLKYSENIKLVAEIIKLIIGQLATHKDLCKEKFGVKLIIE